MSNTERLGKRTCRIFDPPLHVDVIENPQGEVIKCNSKGTPCIGNGCQFAEIGEGKWPFVEEK